MVRWCGAARQAPGFAETAHARVGSGGQHCARGAGRARGVGHADGSMRSGGARMGVEALRVWSNPASARNVTAQCGTHSVAVCETAMMAVSVHSNGVQNVYGSIQ